MQLSERRAGGVAVLDLKGRLVLEEGVPVLRSAIERLVGDGHRQILLNMREVTYVDSCGIGLMIAKLVSVRRSGGDVRLVHLTSRTTHLLEITRLLDVFLVYTSEQDALSSFTSPSGV
jgi:anti-sigma B factor antagonist